MPYNKYKSEDLLRFDQGIMTVSAYDPLLNEYQAPRVLQLPELPLLESLEQLCITTNSTTSSSIRPTKSTRSVQGKRSDGMDQDRDQSSCNRRRRCQSNPNLGMTLSTTTAPSFTTAAAGTITTPTTTVTATMTKRALHKFGSLTRRMSKRSITTVREAETASLISHSSNRSSSKILPTKHHHKRSLSTAFQAALNGMIQKANKKMKHKLIAEEAADGGYNGWVHESWVEELRFSTESVVSCYSLNQSWPYQHRASLTAARRSRKVYKEKHESFLHEAWWSSRACIQKNTAAAAF